MMFAAPSSLLRCALSLVTCALVGCTGRDPLDGASASASQSGGAGSASQGTTSGGTTGSTSGGTTESTNNPTTGLDTEDASETDGEASGLFLLALSTVIAPDLPLQFIVTSTLTTVDGQTSMTLELQPLALDQGLVTTPRTPVGGPLIFEDVAVVEGAFEIDAGVVKVSGMANPITGGEIVASLVLTGSLATDSFCGTVNGEVTSPLEAPLGGSTFAAARITDPADLPLDVALNCAGDTATDSL